ncbi:hypothetical protein [Vallitalea guaymasensis]|uniref:hypothetical protein n=1 Tax=Vallitalea guaymasensis TaxID=1185412 RepID=UPI000DE5793A|nr:hypothetical protein [Vallitalea guaymasensis]
MNSFLIVKGKIQKHNGIAYNTKMARAYLKIILNEQDLTKDSLLGISKGCEAVMIDFHDTIEPNHIEVELYDNHSSVNFVSEWSDKPCSIKLSELKYFSLKKQLKDSSLY